MYDIDLQLFIDSPPGRVFDLARSMELHEESTKQTNERAVDGCMTGLIGLNEWVTWEAKHFGLTMRMTSKIVEFDRPLHFRDEMIAGPFQTFFHDHDFVVEGQGVIMHDRISLASPFGILGYCVDHIFLGAYMKRFLQTRAQVIKACAESEDYQAYLSEETQ